MAEQDLFDYALIRDYLRYVAGSISRHRIFIGLSSVALVLLTALLLRGLPKTYHAETQILALKNTVLTKTMGAPDEEDPTLAAREAILRRDNLVALVRQTDLLKKYPLSRAPLLALKDEIAGALRHGQPLSEEDQLAALVGTLETRLDVQVGAGKVIIALDWPDAAMAYQLVDAASHNFIEQRRTSEVEPLSEAIAIFESHAASVREQIVEDVERVVAAREAAGKKRPKLQEPPKLVIAELEQTRRRQLDDLQAQLREVQKTLAERHPAVLELQHSIEVLQAKEPEREVQLTRRLPATPRQLASATTAEIEDAPIEQAKEDLRFAVSKYSSLLDRIDNTRMNLQSTQANFKHRFTIITPAELPRAPVRPKPLLVLLGSVLGGLALAVFLSALRDVRYGLVFERWQVPRQLGIPVLGELRR